MLFYISAIVLSNNIYSKQSLFALCYFILFFLDETGFSHNEDTLQTGNIKIIFSN